MNWDDYLMGFARHAASKSKDPSTQVGCVIVGPDREIRATGFNGLPRGVADMPERMERPAKYLWTSHAEENAIAHAARTGARLKDCTAYITHHPCARCARSLIQAGVRAIRIDQSEMSVPSAWAEDFLVAEQMLTEAGVVCTEVGP
jgi:dCMP deaminase